MTDNPENSQQEVRPHTRRKKQALKDLEAKTGVAVSKVCEGSNTAADSAAIERQLGFVPTNVFSVASRAESGTADLLCR